MRKQQQPSRGKEGGNEKLVTLIILICLITLYPFTEAKTDIMTVDVDFASPTYPIGTNWDGFISTTDEPLGPFSGESVYFKGIDIGGSTTVYRYRLDFSEVVKINSILIEGAAWRDGGHISLLDENKNEIDRINTSGGNIFKSYTFKLTGVTGDLFYLQEYNTDGFWRYRSNIDVSFNLPGILNAEFTSDVTEGHVPLEVQFSDLSIGDATQWLWDFGDANVSNEQNPIHTYNSFGIYTVSLTISTAELSDTKTKIGFIKVLPDIFGIEVGNKWTYRGTYTETESFYSSENEVVSLDQTTFPMTTYLVEEREKGETYRGWYEKSAEESKLWGEQEAATGEFITHSAGLVEVWYPMQVGDRQYSYATAEDNFYPGIVFNISLTADVLAKKNVILDFDTFKAFKLRYKLRIWGFGIDETITFYQWVVPYLGVVKYKDDGVVKKLTSFAIGGGAITPTSDADEDGLKDYREIIIYDTNWQNEDTEHDGMPDGWEVTFGLDPKRNDASEDLDGDGFSNLREYQNRTDPNDTDPYPQGMFYIIPNKEGGRAVIYLD